MGVQAADQAVLDGRGGAVRIDVSVTCPMTSNGQGGQVTVYQDQVAGTGFFGATPCDGLPHTVSVRVETSSGSFLVGSAQAEAFASVEESGDIFPGSDLRTVQITQA